MIFASAASSPQVWAADHESIQITWGWFPPGRVVIDGIGPTRAIAHPGGPGSALMNGCLPATDYTIEIRPEGRHRPHQLSVTTGRRPPGALLCRVATVSDLHLGARRWGALKTMAELPPSDAYPPAPPDEANRELPIGSGFGPSTRQSVRSRAGTDAGSHPTPAPAPGRPPGPYPEPHPWRCAMGAVGDAVTWGTDLLVLKGDLLHHETEDCLEPLARLVDAFPDLPMLAIPGNHDVDGGGNLLPAAIGRRRLPIVRHVNHVDLPGVRVVVADTTIPNRGRGTVDHVADAIVDVAAAADRPVFLLTHHQLQAHRIAHYWPTGVPAPASTRLLDRLDELDQPVVVTSGHTHRNRVRLHGSVLVTEVASTKDWPGVWAAYDIFEGGISQTVRRVSRGDALVWTEYSRKAVGGLWAHWSPGRRRDRCVSRTWAS